METFNPSQVLLVSELKDESRRLTWRCLSHFPSCCVIHIMLQSRSSAWTGHGGAEAPINRDRKEENLHSLEVVALTVSPSPPNSTPSCIQASQHIPQEGICSMTTLLCLSGIPFPCLGLRHKSSCICLLIVSFLAQRMYPEQKSNPDHTNTTQRDSSQKLPGKESS